MSDMRKGKMNPLFQTDTFRGPEGRARQGAGTRFSLSRCVELDAELLEAQRWEGGTGNYGEATLIIPREPAIHFHSSSISVQNRPGDLQERLQGAHKKNRCGHVRLGNGGLRPLGPKTRQVHESSSSASSRPPPGPTQEEMADMQRNVESLKQELDEEKRANREIQQHLVHTFESRFAEQKPSWS